MNIPLINTNDKESINTSLIAIKRATEELNNLIKIADEKMAQLDEKAKKYTDDKINALDVASVGGSGKYISAISETDGKISATASDITSTVSSGNNQPVTSGGVANYIISGDKNSPISDCNLAIKNGIYYFSGSSSNCPSSEIGYSAPDGSGSLIVQGYDESWVNQICLDFYSNGSIFARSKRYGVWGSWEKYLNLNDLRRILTDKNPLSFTPDLSKFHAVTTYTKGLPRQIEGIQGKHILMEVGYYMGEINPYLQICWGDMPAIVMVSTGVGRVGFIERTSASQVSYNSTQLNFFVIEFDVPLNCPYVGILAENCNFFLYNLQTS